MITINVIFPMAGDGMRFGGIFKPFHMVGENSFIELAKIPFDILKSIYNVQYIFIFRQDQEDKYNVSHNLSNIFLNDTYKICIIPHKTKGPLETLQNGIKLYDLKGISFVCDCDHAINITPYLIKLNNSSTISDVSISIWDITEKDYNSWGQVLVDNDNNIMSFREKDITPTNFNIKGIIGCYLFKNIETLSLYNNNNNNTNIIDILNIFLTENRKLSLTKISHADFFGTPLLLENYKLTKAKLSTYFIDIDGTLLYQNDSITYNINSLKLIEKSLIELKKIIENGHYIVITTARKDYNKTKYILDYFKIPYNYIITGINPGNRIIINDKKPYCSLLQTASSQQNERDKGIQPIININDFEIITKFKGNSFADVYLIKQNNNLFVRKYIYKGKDKLQYTNLKRQVDDIQRFNFYSKGICPRIINIFESSDDYYYDMEYLNNYNMLSIFDSSIQTVVVSKLLNILNRDIYCYSRETNGSEWLINYINNKIISKYKIIESFNINFNMLLNSEILSINNKKVLNLKYIIENIDINFYKPTHISPIHGDLTFENILYNDLNCDIKLIDNVGSEFTDAKELDIGKLLQSIISKYESWETDDSLFQIINSKEYIISDKLLDLNYTNYLYIIDNENDFKKYIFYLSSHLIRAIPYFLHNCNEKKATLSLLLAIYYLSTI